MTCTLDRLGQLTLMLCTGAGHTAGQDLAALRHVKAQLSYVPLVDGFYLIYAEGANLSAATSTALCALRTGSKFLLGLFHCQVPPFFKNQKGTSESSSSSAKSESPTERSKLGAGAI